MQAFPALARVLEAANVLSLGQILRLAIHGFQPLLEMRHQVSGDELDPFWIAHQRLQRGPLGLELLLFRQLLAFRDFLELLVELRQRGGVQAELGTEGAKWGD